MCDGDAPVRDDDVAREFAGRIAVLRRRGEIPLRVVARARVRYGGIEYERSRAQRSETRGDAPRERGGEIVLVPRLSHVELDGDAVVRREHAAELAREKIEQRIFARDEYRFVTHRMISVSAARVRAHAGRL